VQHKMKAHIGVVTINELRIIIFIIRGLRLTDTAAVTVANRLPPKYMYVSRMRCFTISGHILEKHNKNMLPMTNQSP